MAFRHSRSQTAPPGWGDSLIGRRAVRHGHRINLEPELVGRLGAVLADEARSGGVHVLLGPTVCIVRTPGEIHEPAFEAPVRDAGLGP